jgi:saxitoxin biosynthesis operon SxtJ-like protein
MQWSDVTAVPQKKTLRQFAGLWLLFFGSLAAWRMWHRQLDAGTEALGLLAVVVGGVGLVRPGAMRWIYTGWMAAAFPIGWTVSRVMLASLFYAVVTPLALVFRLKGRDVLHLRRTQKGSYWIAKTGTSDVNEYFRQT